MRDVSTQTAGLSVLFITAVAVGAPAQSPSMEGVWRSQGYGNVFEIHGQTLNAFEVTNTTCVPSESAAVDTTPVPGRIATFRSRGSEKFVRAGSSADHKLLHGEGSASDERIDRIPRLPAVCDHPTENTPAGNFEVFAQTWGEHYISFDLKNTDWGKVVEANRSKINSNTTPAELFDIFEKMIGPFGDTHAFLAAPEIDHVFQSLRPGTDRVVKGGFQAFRRNGMPALLGVTDRAYLKTPLRKFCNDQIQYGHIDEATGYLRILSFSNYVKEGGFAAGLAALEAALDDIFSDRTLRALVIDVRINGGGADPYGLAIASRPRDERVPRLHEGGASRPDRPHQVDAGGRQRGSAECPPRLSRTNRRVDRTAHDQRGRDVHSGPDGPDSAHHPDRREHAGRVLRCPGPTASERVALWPAERGVPDTARDNVRRAGHPTGRRGSRVQG
jgi:Tricorn protease C1 domain/Peptidase family S41